MEDMPIPGVPETTDGPDPRLTSASLVVEGEITTTVRLSTKDV